VSRTVYRIFRVAFTGGLLLSLLPALQAQRRVLSGKGEFTDAPSAHPLTYWTEHPLERDDGGDLCLGCVWRDSKITLANYHATVETTRLGVLADHSLVQLLIHVHGDQTTQGIGSEFEWKLLLEQMGPDSYLELYHLQPTVASVAPASLIAVGGESILATYDSDGGNGGGCWEGYWWFDKAGAHPIDFSAVDQAISSVAPHNTTIPTGCWTLHLPEQEIHAPVQESSAACHACGWIGSVTAHFHLEGAIARPDHVTFAPEVAP
jgi:hypothetical protein